MGSVIALSGWRGSGKSTAAKYLVEKWKYTEVSFARALKEEVSRIYNIPVEWCDHVDYKNKPIEQLPVIYTDSWAAEIQRMLCHELLSGYWTPRALCILEGSSRRSVNSNYWVDKVLSQMEMGGNYVVSDLRFRSEIQRLKHNMPMVDIWRVERFDDIDTTNSSERDLDDYRFEFRLNNKGNVESLCKQIDTQLTNVTTQIDWIRRGPKWN